MVKRLMLFLGIILVIFTTQVIEIGAQDSDSAKSETVTTIVGNPVDEATPKPSIPAPGGGGGNTGKHFVYYCQKDERYNDACSYAWAICGPTSLAMVMSSFGVDMTPKDVDNKFTSTGWRSCGDEPSYMEVALQSPWLRDQGFKVIKLSGNYEALDLNLAKQAIDAGNLIIGSVAMHIFVIDDVNPADGTVHLRDPDKTCDENGYWAPATTPWIFQGVPRQLFYSYSLIKS